MMNCLSPTKRFRPNDLTPGQDLDAERIMKSLGFSERDLDLLYTAFWDIDADGSGTIISQELFIYFGVENHEFERRIFSLFDEDGRGEINFMEFVSCMWNFLSSTIENFGEIIYVMAKGENKDKLTFAEFENIMKIMNKVNGSIDSNKNLKGLFQTFRSQHPHSKPITIEIVRIFIESHPDSVQNLIMLQVRLQQELLGERFWKKKRKERLNNAMFHGGAFIHKLMHDIEQYSREKNARIKLDNEIAWRKEYLNKGNKRKRSSIFRYFGLGEKVVPSGRNKHGVNARIQSDSLEYIPETHASTHMHEPKLKQKPDRTRSFMAMVLRKDKKRNEDKREREREREHKNRQHQNEQGDIEGIQRKKKIRGSFKAAVNVLRHSLKLKKSKNQNQHQHQKNCPEDNPSDFMASRKPRQRRSIIKPKLIAK